MFNSLGKVLNTKKSKAKYPEARVIVLDDSFNTFQHVANCLQTIIPGMSEKRAWDLTIKIDKTGSAEVWRGNLEQAELYHEQLFSKGLTWLPLRKHKITMNDRRILAYKFESFKGKKVYKE